MEPNEMEGLDVADAPPGDLFAEIAALVEEVDGQPLLYLGVTLFVAFKRYGPRILARFRRAETELDELDEAFTDEDEREEAESVLPVGAQVASVAPAIPTLARGRKRRSLAFAEV